MVPTSVAEWIRTRREDAKLTQRAFAMKLSSSGASAHSESVYRWEAGTVIPPDWRLLQILDACSVPEGAERDLVFRLAREDRIRTHGAPPTTIILEGSETVADPLVSDPRSVANG